MEKPNTAILSVAFASLAGCASMQLGGGKTATTGAAAGETAQSVNRRRRRSCHGCRPAGNFPAPTSEECRS